jgi:hypothetical protein
MYLTHLNGTYHDRAVSGATDVHVLVLVGALLRHLPGALEPNDSFREFKGLGRASSLSVKVLKFFCWTKKFRAFGIYVYMTAEIALANLHLPRPYATRSHMHTGPLVIATATPSLWLNPPRD